jgi:hypothetical protein
LGSLDGAQWLLNQGRAVFSQFISFLPDREFRRCVERYQGDSRLRGFSCWDQYLSMAFAQLTYRESLRDIEACLHSVQGKLYHLGFRGKVARSTLADANESHDWRIFADFAQVLIGIARPLYGLSATCRSYRWALWAGFFRLGCTPLGCLRANIGGAVCYSALEAFGQKTRPNRKNTL